MFARLRFLLFFFFNDTATTEIYTLSLHDALPISSWTASSAYRRPRRATLPLSPLALQRRSWRPPSRSEEHTSELQSHSDLVCRLLLEKKKYQIVTTWPLLIRCGQGSEL